MITDLAAADELSSLYHRAFAVHGVHALWNLRAVDVPTSADALAITKALRMDGRRLAERIEELCRADR